MNNKKVLSGLLLGTVIAGPLAAQTNLEKMSSVQTTGTSFEAQLIEQGGEKADQLRKHLEKITMPEGFKIDLYAIVLDARHMAVAPQSLI